MRRTPLLPLAVPPCPGCARLPLPQVRYAGARPWLPRLCRLVAAARHVPAPTGARLGAAGGDEGCAAGGQRAAGAKPPSRFWSTRPALQPGLTRSPWPRPRPVDGRPARLAGLPSRLGCLAHQHSGAARVPGQGGAAGRSGQQARLGPGPPRCALPPVAGLLPLCPGPARGPAAGDGGSPTAGKQAASLPAAPRPAPPAGLRCTPWLWAARGRWRSSGPASSAPCACSTGMRCGRFRACAWPRSSSRGSQTLRSSSGCSRQTKLRAAMNVPAAAARGQSRQTWSLACCTRSCRCSTSAYTCCGSGAASQGECRGRRGFQHPPCSQTGAAPKLQPLPQHSRQRHRMVGGGMAPTRSRRLQVTDRSGICSHDGSGSKTGGSSSRPRAAAPAVTSPRPAAQRGARSAPSALPAARTSCSRQQTGVEQSHAPQQQQRRRREWYPCQRA